MRSYFWIIGSKETTNRYIASSQNKNVAYRVRGSSTDIGIVRHIMIELNFVLYVDGIKRIYGCLL